ncbi:helix-turn-helix domain-containing protein [Paenibacillus thalictri]|nr:helix-turn-helix domain-containing protein [Paenibacillus thalictri]
MILKFTRYQIKLFLLCLLFGAIPVLVLGVFSYVKFSSSIQSKVHSGNDQLLLQTETQIENTLKLIDFSVFQLTSSPQITDILKTKITNKEFPLVENTLSSLQRVQVYELGIKEIQLVNVVDGWGIGNGGFAQLTDMLDKDRLAYYTNIEKPSMWLTDKIVFPHIDAAVNNVYLVKKIPFFSKNPNGLLVTRLSNHELFKSLPETSDLGTMMILDERQNVIAYTESSSVGGKVAASPYVQNIYASADAKGYMVGAIDGSEYGITYRKSAYNGWVYLSAVSISEITRESRSIGWVTFWTCAGMIVLISALSLQGASRLYTPVRRLYRAVAAGSETSKDSDASDEFKLIERRFEHLSLNQQQQRRQLRLLHQQSKQYVVIKLIQGDIPPHDIKEQLALYGYEAESRWLAVAAIQIDSLLNTRFKESDRDLLLFAVGNIIEEMVPEARRLAPVVIRHTQVTIFHGNEETEEAFKAFIDETVHRIQDNVSAYLNLKVSAGVSRSYHSHEMTPRAYAEGLDALKYRMTKEKEAVLFIEDVQPETQMVSFPDHLEQQLVEAVKQADENKAVTLCREFMQIVANRELTLHQRQNWLMKLLLDIIYIPEQMHIIVPGLSAGDIPLYEQLSQFQTMDEIEGWFEHHIIGPLVKALDHGKDAQYKLIAQEIIRIIESEFDRDITMEECASRLHYHASYIRRALKKSCNLTFSDYLLQYRMDVAKKWLTETEMTVTDIAVRLRYNNPQNFIRYFKKATDMTPGQYREKWRT